MHRGKGTTPKALQIKQQKQQEGTNYGVGESSFRVLYYGTASAGSVPFMWESQPGTPKHALIKSSLPPLTPPPSYHQFNQKYNSSMQLIGHSKRSSLFRAIFLASSGRKTDAAAPPLSSFSSCSVSSSSSSSSQSTPVRKTEFWRRRLAVKLGLDEDYGDQGLHGGGGSPTSTLCLGGGIKKANRIKKVKKAMLSFVGHGVVGVPGGKLDSFVALTWVSWNLRNNECFGISLPPIEDSISWVGSLCLEKEAGVCRPPKLQVDVKWQAPDGRGIKINVDAGIDSVKGESRCGLVARNNKGEVLSSVASTGQ